MLGVDEETFRAVLDWIYAGIFPKPESTGTQTTHDARTHWRMARARHASSRSTHRLDMRAYIRLYNAAVKLGVDSLAAVAKAFLQGQSTRSRSSFLTTTTTITFFKTDYIEAHRQHAPKGALGLFFNSKMLRCVRCMHVVRVCACVRVPIFQRTKSSVAIHKHVQ